MPAEDNNFMAVLVKRTRQHRSNLARASWDHDLHDVGHSFCFTSGWDCISGGYSYGFVSINRDVKFENSASRLSHP